MTHEATKQAEGWGVLRPGERRFHFYRGGRSLCGRVAFYNSSLDADDGPPMPRDCKMCRKKLEQERQP